MTNEVVHTIQLSGSDVDITRFVDYFDNFWVKQWRPLLNTSELTLDLGSYTLLFSTKSSKISIDDFLLKLSAEFPYLHIKYRCFENLSNSGNVMNFHFYGGKIVDKK